MNDELTEDFTKHLMARHSELAQQVRDTTREVLDLIEQYTRFDYFMWLMHDPSGLQSDPCARALKAKEILAELQQLKYVIVPTQQSVITPCNGTPCTDPTHNHPEVSK